MFPPAKEGPADEELWPAAPGRNTKPSFKTVATTEEIAAGDAKLVHLHGRQIALFNADGRYYAVDNACNHRGAPLVDGDLEGTVLRCPWHGWSFDVTTGRNLFNPETGVACFEVRVVGKKVQIRG